MSSRVDDGGLRVQLEADLLWRQDELRHLRNTLIGSLDRREDWPASSLRALLVMQYAHLEGFTQTALTLYVDHINQSGLRACDLHLELVAAALSGEFKSLRTGADGEEAAEGESTLLRRAKRQAALVKRLRECEASPISINPEHAISLEMNLGEAVLRKNLFVLAIPSDKISRDTYGALEFVRRNRNDIAHGSRKEKIEPGLFEAHWSKCWAYMDELVILVSTAAREKWYVPAAA